MAAEPRPQIHVLAGTNGAGKSSILGETLRSRGAEYFNPDEVARKILASAPGISQTEANKLAWNEGRRLLERAIAERRDFAFETTLGGKTIPELLEKAARAGVEVRVWYVGLSSVELHLARVRSRAASGGHDIPEEKVRERFDASRRNLVRLMPHLAELRVLDNSNDGDPDVGGRPKPTLVLHVRDREIRSIENLASVPDWAKPIVAAALKLCR